MRKRGSSQHHNFISSVKKPFESRPAFDVGGEGAMGTAARGVDFPVPQVKGQSRGLGWQELPAPLIYGGFLGEPVPRPRWMCQADKLN